MLSAGSRWSVRSVPTAVSGLAATAGVVVVLGIACRNGRSSVLVDPLLRTWSRAWLVPAGVRLQVEGVDHIRPGQAYVVVSNHLSNLDPMVHIAGVPLPMRFLAMRALFDMPVLGKVMRDIGMIEVDREDPDMRTIRDGTRRALSNGISVLVYPEGKTSGDGSIDSFHTGAFVLAISNRVPVLPVTLMGTRSVWTPGSNAIRRGTVRLVIGTPIATDEMAPRDAVALRDDVRGWIVATYLRRDATRA
ncbi:MAG: lysophospholipid acyltransferase family protein [bacterium]|nr:lysophospholipid acyltransferase family protein [bacterium]